MKVLYFFGIDFPDTKSHSIQAINTCYALAEEGVEVSFFARKMMGQSPEEVLRPFGLKPHPRLSLRSIPFKDWDGPLFKGWLLTLLLKEKGEGDTFLMLRGRKSLEAASHLIHWRPWHGLPVIYEVHALDYLFKGLKVKEKGDEVGEADVKKFSQLRQKQEEVFTKASGLICISEHLQETISTFFRRRGPMSVAHDGCQIPKENNGEAKRDIEIIYSGRLKPWKGIDLLIEAMAHLPERRLFVVGGNTEEDLKRLNGLVKALGLQDRVHFTGHVKPYEVAQYLRRSKVSVIPILKKAPSEDQEGFTSPLKMFEAMALKTPIVASDMPSLREVLRSGENALLFKPNDARALAMTIEKVLTNDRLAHGLALKAYEDVKEYTWQRRAQRIVSFLQSLGEQNKG